MDAFGERDHFHVLEEKIDSLLETVTRLRRERESFEENARIQGEKVADLTEQVSTLKEARDRAKQKIVTLLEKIEQIGI